MPVRLCYRGQVFAVVPGSYVIGRSAVCQFTLDDPLVSRRHALLTVRQAAAAIEDLGSRNRVQVNGRAIVGRHELFDGNRITIGDQHIVVRITPVTEDDMVSRGLLPPQRLRFGSQDAGVQHWIITTVSSSERGPVEQNEELPVLTGLAEEALDKGDVREAERHLHRPLAEVLATLRAGLLVEPAIVQFATNSALRLAEASRNPFWVDYVIDLYLLLDLLMPERVLNRVVDLSTRIKSIDHAALAAYCQKMSRKAAKLSPPEQLVFRKLLELEFTCRPGPSR